MSGDERAADAFGTLGDPTRVGILRSFAAVMDERELSRGGGMPTLSFSEVYERTDLDSTSRLSYHLDELEGNYLRQTDEGWTMTFAGNAIVRLVLSGAYAGGIDFEPVETPGECPFCNTESLEADVQDRVLLFVCGECESRSGAVPVTPAQVHSRDPESLVDSTATRTVAMFRQFRNGVCSVCGGVVDRDVEVRPVEAVADAMEFVGTGRCRQCWWRLNAPPSMWLSYHPASVAFHWDNDVDVLSQGPRDLGAKLGSGQWDTERVATDPDEFRIRYRVDGNELRLTVDDDLELLRTERVRRT
jgi:hypothetical protein